MEVVAPFGSEYGIENIYIMRKQIEFKIPPLVQALIENYFEQIFTAHTWIKFEGGMPNKLAGIVFLHWVVVYSSEREFGIYPPKGFFFICFVLFVHIALQHIFFYVKKTSIIMIF